MLFIKFSNPLMTNINVPKVVLHFIRMTYSLLLKLTKIQKSDQMKKNVLKKSLSSWILCLPKGLDLPVESRVITAE